MSIQLAVTVGGSCQPVLTAIQDYQPEFVCLLLQPPPTLMDNLPLPQGKGPG